jgi:YVTN family beta-propeller protein
MRASCSLLLLVLSACNHYGFPDVPEGYREFAYVANGASNTVSVLDLVYLRQDRTLQVGPDPTGLAANPVRNEVYVVSTQPAQSAGSVAVIDTTKNAVVSTIPVHRLPYFIAVDPTGHRAYVANSGSNTVSVLDLDRRRLIYTAATGEQPGLTRVAPDGRTLVVTNHGSNSVSIYDVAIPDSSKSAGALGPMATPVYSGPPLRLRASFAGCPGPTDAVILPDSSKTFVACSGGHQVMAIGLAMPAASWQVKLNPSLSSDHFLTLLDVGRTPTHLALKPDGGEIFVTNFGSGSISEIDTQSNEVGGTYAIGMQPSQGVVSSDNSTLWVSNFGADTVTLYSVEDGRVVGSLHTGAAPDALAFSADEHLLLAADAHSGDVAVLRTDGHQGAALFTMLPAGHSPNSIVVKANKPPKP